MTTLHGVKLEQLKDLQQKAMEENNLQLMEWCWRAIEGGTRRGDWVALAACVDEINKREREAK